MSAKLYLESFDPFFKHDEEMSLMLLIQSHKYLREAELRRRDFWATVPTWKKRLARFLGLTLWP